MRALRYLSRSRNPNFLKSRVRRWSTWDSNLTPAQHLKTLEVAVLLTLSDIVHQSHFRLHLLGSDLNTSFVYNCWPCLHEGGCKDKERCFSLIFLWYGHMVTLGSFHLKRHIFFLYEKRAPNSLNHTKRRISKNMNRNCLKLYLSLHSPSTCATSTIAAHCVQLWKSETSIRITALTITLMEIEGQMSWRWILKS